MGFARTGVTVPEAAAQAVLEELSGVGLVKRAKIVGSSGGTTGIALEVFSVNGGVQDLDRHVRKYGGKVGLREEWITSSSQDSFWAD